MLLKNLTQAKRHRVHIYIAIGVAILILLCFIHMHGNVVDAYQQNMRCDNERISSIGNYHKKHNKLKTKLLRHSLQSTDSIVKSVAVNNYENTAPKKALLQFFNVFYNWHSAKKYNARASKLRNIVSKPVLANKKLFPIVRNSKQNHTNYIDAEGLNYQFNDLDTYYLKRVKNTLVIVAEAQYEKWYDKGKTQAVNAVWYEISYDTKQKKIVNIKQVYSKPNLHTYSD